MNDFSKLMIDAESELERLKKQAAEEKAMSEVLPIRFEQNIIAFEKLIPDIAAQFRKYSPEKKFRFFCNENGIPNLLWLDDKTSLYGDDPYKDCLEQVEKVFAQAKTHRFNFSIEDNVLNQIHVDYLNKLVEVYKKGEKELESQQMVGDSIPLCMLFGIGLGYQLGYLYERCLPKTLFLFEPDKDLFYASLYSFDWAGLLEFIFKNNLGLHIFIGQNEDSIMEDMLNALNKRGAFLGANFIAFFHYPSANIYKLMERVAKEIYLLSTGWGFFDDNMSALAHSAQNISRKIPFLLKGKMVENSINKLPVFVIGNGPSLDKSIRFIHENQEKAIIISCGTSISALHRAGIKPDIYITIERIKAAADFVSLLNDSDYLNEILFLSTDVTHPNVHQYFRRSGLGFKPNEPMFPLCLANIHNTDHFEGLRFVNPLVGNAGVCFPITLGFKNIFLFGIDNGYKDKSHHHSKLSAYYDKDGNPIELISKMVTEKSGLCLPGNFGGEVIANRLFASSAKIIGRLLKDYSDVKCYNCSDGVLIDNTIPLHVEDIKLSDVISSKKEIIDHIYDDMFEPFPADISLLEKALAPDLYCEMIDKLVAHWLQPLVSRNDVIERMQQQFEFITSLANTQYHHIFRVLVGTMNYVFSIVSTMAYRFENDEKTMDIVRQGIDVVIDYFENTKKVYPNAFSQIDMTEDKILNYFRQN